MKLGINFLAFLTFLNISTIHGGDPYLFFNWNVTYGTITPLGVPQRGILINGQFPGPNINSTTNNNIVINVFNNLDEPLLFTWNGIQQRKNSWLDGMPGTNCPILPGTNFTYHFQVKDQIGSYFYFPSTGLHKLIGGFGGLRVNSRPLIPVPFDAPADDFTVLIGDWYSKALDVLHRILDSGRSLARPPAVLINGKSRPTESNRPMFNVNAGKTYRFRICNVGSKTSLNFRVQNHSMKLVEMDGSHTVQNMYGSLDVHVGQCYSVLMTADRPIRDYLMVVSTRFLKSVSTATAVIRYAGSKTPPDPELPMAPTSWAWSLNQWRSFRWNLTASAARPNPQGSYHYGLIPVARTIILDSSMAMVNGKRRYAINGVSHVDGSVPLKLAEHFNVTDQVFKFDMIGDVPPRNTAPVKIAPNVIRIKYRSFVEIILQNSEHAIQSYHLDGYSFFPVGMGPGKWSNASRSKYNLLDTVSRHTIQVYPKSWTAIMLTFDNAGMWNLRSNLWERFHLGQQLYISVASPERSINDENNMPSDTLLCGIVSKLPLPPAYT